MIINKYNIEKWMFDYFEGNLTQHEQIEFERFMENHAQFDADFEFWKESYDRNVETPVYEIPQNLYKVPFWTIQKIGALMVLSVLLISSGYFMYNSIRNEENNLVEKNIDSTEVDDQKFIVNNTNSNINNVSKEEQGTSPETGAKESKKIKANKVSVKSGFITAQINQAKQEVRIESKDVIEKNNKGKSNLGLSSSQNRVKSKTKRCIESIGIEGRKIKSLVYSTNEKGVLNYKFKPLKENNKYAFLDFKRSNNKHKKNASLNKAKGKERDKKYFENIAIISTLFYRDKSKQKQKKRLKMFDKFKNKEIALTNTHDPIFIITNSNPIENNLALTGGLNVTRFKTNISNRWMNSINQRNKVVLNGDTYISKLNAGVGFSANLNDYPNQNLNQTSFGVTYSQRIQLKEESSLSLGVNYKFNVNKYNLGSSVVELNQNETYLLNNSVPENEQNFSTALWYDGKFLFGGINLDNINYLKKQNNNANEFVEYINPFKFAIQLGTDYRRNIYSAWVISPQVNYRYQQNTSELWLGGMLKYKRLLAGLGGSFSDAYKVNFGVQGDNFRLIYGYDYSKTKVENHFYGTHEVSIRYLLRGKNNWKK